MLFHDAVRPFIDHRVIEDCVNALDRTRPSTWRSPRPTRSSRWTTTADVINDVPVAILAAPRADPAGFRLSTIREAYRVAQADPDFTAAPTDDCSVVLRYLPGRADQVDRTAPSENIKVTHPVDVFLADKLFQLALARRRPRRSAPRRTTPSSCPARPSSSSAAATASARTSPSWPGRSAHGSTRSPGPRPAPTSRASADVEAALPRPHFETGRIDYVVITAGILHNGALDEIDEAIVEESLQVNYLGPVQIARAAIGYLQQTKGQLLLYTSSSLHAGPRPLRALLLDQGRPGQPHSGAGRRMGRRTGCASTASTPNGPRRRCAPRAFGEEPEDSLLASRDVALTSIDVLISDLTGHTIDIRRHDPTAVAR